MWTCSHFQQPTSPEPANLARRINQTRDLQRIHFDYDIGFDSGMGNKTSFSLASTTTVTNSGHSDQGCHEKVIEVPLLHS